MEVVCRVGAGHHAYWSLLEVVKQLQAQEEGCTPLLWKPSSTLQLDGSVEQSPDLFHDSADADDIEETAPFLDLLQLLEQLLKRLVPLFMILQRSLESLDKPVLVGLVRGNRFILFYVLFDCLVLLFYLFPVSLVVALKSSL